MHPAPVARESLCTSDMLISLRARARTSGLGLLMRVPVVVLSSVFFTVTCLHFFVILICFLKSFIDCI